MFVLGHPQVIKVVQANSTKNHGVTTIDSQTLKAIFKSPSQEGNQVNISFKV